ncbi:LytR/AlgR family response regulator transcription factor [Enterococcus lactis]|uniref:LytR/AlgR family response regulator transcription factor n=1 Tax=Enterococcus lactis TaxID=357441 RepID=UPI0034E933FE
MKIYILEDNYIHRKYIESKVSLLDLAMKYQIILLENDALLNFYNRLDYLSIQKEDIFLIDINLNSFHTGIDIAEKIRLINKDCFIIFISSEVQYGIEIINRRIRPIAYLSKQLQEGKTLEKQLQQIFNKIEVYINKEVIAGEKLLISTREKTEYISLSEVNYIETIKGNRYAVNIHYIDGTDTVNKSFSYFRRSIATDVFLQN